MNDLFNMLRNGATFTEPQVRQRNKKNTGSSDHLYNNKDMNVRVQEKVLKNLDFFNSTSTSTSLLGNQGNQEKKGEKIKKRKHKQQKMPCATPD